jgi:hypothetical protein
MSFVRVLLSPADFTDQTADHTYDAFGNTVAQTGSTVNEFLYRGEQYDAAGGYGPGTVADTYTEIDGTGWLVRLYLRAELWLEVSSAWPVPL